VQVKSRRGESIATLDDWRDLGGPASVRHWKDGRSAKCLAESWLEGSGSEDLADLLATESSGRLSNFEVLEAIAEAQSCFDSFRGGKRNHDLLILGETGGGRLVIGIEGKADEPFGETIGEYREAARRREASGKSTNAPARLDGLLRAVGGFETDPDRLDQLRYQLFSAVAGTLAAAREGGCDRAVFLVHEFVTDRTDPDRQAANLRDLDDFLAEILHLPAQESDGWIVGPTYVPGSEFIPASVPLWVGHLRTIRT
jgi:hypothetical protein